VYRCSNDLEERGGYNLYVSFVLLDVLTDSFSWIHIITVTWGHLSHDLNQRLDQTPQVVVTVNFHE